MINDQSNDQSNDQINDRSNDPIEGVGIFIDIRRSSEIETGLKEEIYSFFYQKVNKLQKKHEFSHIAYVGDGILLFKEMDESQLNDLIKFLEGLRNNVIKNEKPIEENKIKFGIGMSYGEVINIQTEDNHRNTSAVIVGSVLDEAAKASNIPNKVQYSIDNNYDCRIVSNQLMVWFENEYSEDNERYKKSASGKGVWINSDIF